MDITMVKPTVDAMFKSLFVYNEYFFKRFLISVLDEEDTDPGHLMFALNDLERYRRLVINNYKQYLDKKYLKILMDKMNLIEQELKSKIKIDIKDFFVEEAEFEIEEQKKGRKR